MDIKEITDLRRRLHREPEVSNSEHDTAAYITSFMERFNPSLVLEIASTGRAFVFEGDAPGPTVMFRAELDALPISEETGLEYSSSREGVMHACGHDGHMSILVGLASLIAADRPKKGRVVLLFQPAEEVEQGARDVVNDPAFKTIEPDFIFALHNMPGYKRGEALLRHDTFAAASRALVVKLRGRTSHAGEPEKGISPALAVARIVQGTAEMMRDEGLFEDVAFLTVVYIKVGEPSAGTTPGYGEMMMTLRSYLDSDMERLTERTERLVRTIADDENLQAIMSWEEIFPAVVNSREAVDIAEKAATDAGIAVRHLEAPNRWSEDFAYFTAKYKGAIFGLGAGEAHPPLHDPKYDFPDELIEPGAEIFYNIYKSLL